MPPVVKSRGSDPGPALRTSRISYVVLGSMPAPKKMGLFPRTTGVRLGFFPGREGGREVGGRGGPGGRLAGERGGCFGGGERKQAGGQAAVLELLEDRRPGSTAPTEPLPPVTAFHPARNECGAQVTQPTGE